MPSTGSPGVDEPTVIRRIADGGPALVALSGGVDSALVAALARDALGETARAATVTGSAVSADEVARARQVARAVGIEHDVVAADPIARPEYRANAADRCYHCRSVETAALRSWGRERGVRQFLDGVQLDDLEDDRPGIRAMNEAGFRHPLLDAGWGKATVRERARRRGLPNWATPSNACLASRVAHGLPITPELLARVEAAEATVAARGFRRVRVRVDPAGARIVVDPEDVPRLQREPLATEVLREVRDLGFERASIDPAGYLTRRGTLPVVR
jgi:pyridinium-3,5-biscarboxylic acid mononucleotide sulfurtransferase